MKRTQWLMEQVRELSPGDFADFRRRFLDFDAEHRAADPEARAEAWGIDPEVVEALASWQDGTTVRN